MDRHDCSEKMAAAIRDLGVLPGETVLVHSSFKSLGPIAGGIETVVWSFLQAIGTDGTLLMPALSYALRPPETFDVRLTPTNVGAIPEYFRAREGTRRSLHPTHSVCAVGRRMRELLDDHELDCTPCGRHSPFRKITETRGKIVMLGCGVRPNTTMHDIEEYVEPPYLYDGQTCLFTIRDRHGNVCQKEYRTHGFKSHGYTQRYDRVMELDSCSFVCRGQVLQASAVVFDAPGLKSAVIAKLKEDPYFFVDALPNRVSDD